MTSPTVRSPLTLLDPQVAVHSSGCKKEPGLKERNMRNRYPSTSQGGAARLTFPPHSLHPRTPSASFPDPTASPVVQPGAGGAGRNAADRTRSGGLGCLSGFSLLRSFLTCFQLPLSNHSSCPVGEGGETGRQRGRGDEGCPCQTQGQTSHGTESWQRRWDSKTQRCLKKVQLVMKERKRTEETPQWPFG
ncbi:Hypothetical predicted protein [Lynx pardinus]|uniref:Uncharacterized protein n=1 Tax=Lynx pardinus TaxID=191816 RepID=A0A485N5H0_LYNPA|nr:Hypothetical predicted protein [Lynx pardinus]